MTDRESNWRKEYKKQKPLEAALRISCIYLACGAVWILFSDQALNSLVSDQAMFARFSLIKGWFYIVMTALLLFYLINKVMLKMSTAERKLHDQYLELLDNREKLHQIAFRDQLTGLPNRLALYENLILLKDVSLFYLDLDDFKYVNDTLGHVFGDRLIGEISERLNATLKPSEQVYRLGGDEWIIVSRESEDQLQIRLEKLLGLFHESFAVGEHRMHMTASVGISRFPSHGRTLEQLLKNAHIALYQAKKQGKNTYAFYEMSLSIPIQHRTNMERLLRNALDNGEFELHYQPQINVDSGLVVGFEALIRWKSPELGSVQPDHFIKIAEETQLIIPIGEWVLRTACNFIRNVHENEGDAMLVSVNVSVVQLIGHGFVDQVVKILQETGLEPRFLELEITETMVIESLDLIADKLSHLNALGVNIALDDFGRGFSSFSHLMKLPITTLKIDKSFIDQIPESRVDQPLTGLIIRFAKSMGIKVVAEGVEKYVQLDYLRKYECDCIQGFLFSKPIPDVQVIEWMQKAMIKEA
jgi:diguanylate cyclase (GGDEF)-like protein